MTLQEKLGQMTQRPAPRQDRSSGELLGDIRAGRVGSILNTRDLQHREELQRAAVEGSRLKIPLLFGRDVIHGYRTAFPIPLGQASSFNPELVEEAAAIAAREAKEEGIDWSFAPMIDVARDPRWGRVAEGFGEDPELVACLGAAVVRGFQGQDPSDDHRIAACAKHFAGYGAVEAGREYSSTFIPEQQLHEVYLVPFERAVRQGVLTLMSAFNDLNGVPATGNEQLLRRILKQAWGFQGLVVSDWAAVKELIPHGLCEDERHAAEVALIAGVDLEMASSCFFDHLGELIESGKVDRALVDQAVIRILGIKERLGLFDRPSRPAPSVSCQLSSPHLEVAQRLAEQSLVLLKNHERILPLSPELRRLAVIGPLADSANDQIGCWCYDADRERAVTPLGALRAYRERDWTIDYTAGLPDCRSKDTSGFDAAISAAQSADLTLLFVGESAQMSGEARSRAFLDLPGAQHELLEQLAGTGRPLVTIVLAGRPLIVSRAAQLSDALIYAWHPGTMAGPALLELLLGNQAPSGKLPISLPRAVGQIPIYYAHKSTGRPPSADSLGITEGTPMDPKGMDARYLDVEVSPLYPFGFGLSYTSFEYHGLEVTPRQGSVEQSVEVRVWLVNTGAVTATEVVQLYVADLVASVTRPVRELKAFRRVTLQAGARQLLRFTLGPSQLSLVNRSLSRVVEPGRFRVFLGGDSRASLCADFELT